MGEQGYGLFFLFWYDSYLTRHSGCIDVSCFWLVLTHEETKRNRLKMLLCLVAVRSICACNYRRETNCVESTSYLPINTPCLTRHSRGCPFVISQYVDRASNLGFYSERGSTESTAMASCTSKGRHLNRKMHISRAVSCVGVLKC